MSLNLIRLRNLHPRELAIEFRQLLLSYSDSTISAQLLAKLEEGSVPASVVCIWLSACNSPVALGHALFQSHSVLVRRYAIKRIGEALRKAQWRNIWDYLGGVEGLLSVFAHLSVRDVKLLARGIGRCSTGRPDEEKQRRVTELLYGLLGPLYPDTLYQTRDERPLRCHYAKMAPACSPDFIRTILDQNTSPLLGCFVVDHLLPTQYGDVRQRVLNGIFNGASRLDNHREYLQSLLRRMPPVPGPEPGLSASMSFSLTLLRRLSQQPKDADFPSELFFPEVVEPLLRRALRKRIDTPVICEIVELAVSYVQKNPGAARKTPASHGGFLYYLVRCWSRNQELFEDDLVSTLSFRQEKCNNIGQYDAIFTAVPFSKRYTLLRLLILHTKGLGADISVDEELRSLRLEKWPCSIFTNMAKEQAASLLRALIRVKPAGSFLRLETGSTILAVPRSPGVDYVDPLLLLTLLERGQARALERAQKAVEEQKRKASTSREQSDRAFFARLALFWAIASGSLAFYGETVIWARRFIRDPLTTKTLYRSGTSDTAEGIALLSGIPFDLSREWSAFKLRTRVSEANNVLLGFFETFCQAQREPSFASYDWRATLMLFRAVVEARLDEAPKLQQAIGLSDDELYETMWFETLKMLIQVEKSALQHGNEALDFDLAKGPLCYNHNGFKPLREPLPSSYRFIDSLARARNDLWQELRPTFHPSAAILPRPWPRGLPIQCLPGPFDIASSSANGLTPFIAARAAATVFLESSLALSPCPDDPDVRLGIGRFVDSYISALRLYVLQASDSQERAERETAAWAYALRDLTGERMTPDEAFRTWKAPFLEALPSFKPPTADPDQEAENWPIIPADIDPQENTEWDPTFHQPQVAESRPLSPTFLDCALAANPHSTIRISEDFLVPHPSTKGMVPGDIWSLARFGHIGTVPFAVREGLVASALLFLDSKKAGPSRLLASPFPAAVDIRYPPLFLDADFLLKPKLHEHYAEGVLRSLISIVPPKLLAALADATLKVLSSMPEGSSEVAPLERMAYHLLCLLLSSDRPQLASDLVLQAVIDRPEASSWHRAVLNVGIARTLPPGDAQSLLSSFATSTSSKLEEQTKFARTCEAHTATDGAPFLPKPKIKVTTVKYLAQILDGADFVPSSFVVEVLSELLSSAAHLDVRVAVVNSLLGMLVRCTEESSVPLAQGLLSALETTIPLVSGVNERYLMDEVDWAEAQRTGVPPRVYDEGNMESLPPILSQLVNCITQDFKWRENVVNRVLLPIIERSRVSNAQWIKIFLSKHQPALKVSELPRLPVKPVILSKMLRNCLDLVPGPLLDLYQQFVLSNMAPLREIQDVTNMVRNHGDIRASNEGRHWLSLYGHGTGAYHQGRFSLAKTLRRKWSPSITSNPVQIPKVQRLVLQQAEQLLNLSDPAFTEWCGFVQELEPPPGIWRRDEDWEAWLANGKPLLARVISRVQSLRTPEWQRDPNRKPAILPPTFSSRLWLLSYPYDASVRAEKDDSCRIFAEELVALIHEVVSDHKIYHEYLGHIVRAASRCPAELKAHVACYLGSLSSISSPTDVVGLLRVELAESLYSGAQLPQDSDIREVAKEVLATWRASKVEEIRMKGLRVSSQLQRNAPGKNGWGLLAERDLP